MKRLLITGATGLLGSNLLPLAAGRFETLGLGGSFAARVPGRFLSLDLTNTAEVDRVVRSFHPEIILHGAAMTAPVECENNPGPATRVNVDATRHLASLAAGLGARFLFLSTDLVFDGARGLYREDDATGPLSHYARTKVEAERLTRQIATDSLIVRTSLMVGRSPRGTRSVNEMIGQALARGETLKLFTDEFRTVIGARNLAEALLELSERDVTGVLHVAGPERRSRYETAIQIARHFGWDESKIQPASRLAYDLKPPRPPDVSLDIRQAQRLLNTRIQPIEEVLHEFHS